MNNDRYIHSALPQGHAECSAVAMQLRWGVEVPIIKRVFELLPLLALHLKVHMHDSIPKALINHALHKRV